MDYATSTPDQEEVRKVCYVAISLLREPLGCNNLWDTTYFRVFCFSKFRTYSSKVLNDFGLNDFTLVQKGTKRPLNENISTMPLNNKFSNLSNESNLDNQMNQHVYVVTNESGISKTRINPFYKGFD